MAWSQPTLDNGAPIVSLCPCTPPGKTRVDKQKVGSMIPGNDEDVYTIPNGETLVMIRFAGGSEHNTSNKIELWYDPNGDGTGMTLLRVGYNSDFEFQINFMYVGDGTKKIRLRRTALGSGSREVAGFWEGFY